MWNTSTTSPSIANRTRWRLADELPNIAVEEGAFRSARTALREVLSAAMASKTPSNHREASEGRASTVAIHWKTSSASKRARRRDDHSVFTCQPERRVSFEAQSRLRRRPTLAVLHLVHAFADALDGIKHVERFENSLERRRAHDRELGVTVDRQKHRAPGLLEPLLEGRGLGLELGERVDVSLTSRIMARLQRSNSA